MKAVARPSAARLSSLALAAVAAVSGPHDTAWAQGRQQTVAIQGQSAPGLAGGSFGTFETAVLNDASQTAFRALLVAPGSPLGIYRSGPGSLLTPIALQGQGAPGAGGVFGGLNDPVLNNAGQLAFYAGVAGSPNSHGIFATGGGAGLLSAVVLPGQAAPLSSGGQFQNLENPVINDAGQIAFAASIGGGNTPRGLYRASTAGGGATRVASTGQNAPGAGVGIFAGFGEPALGASGHVAFVAGIIGGSSTNGLYVGTGNSPTPVALQGQAAPGTGGGAFDYFDVQRTPNGSGQVAFLAGVSGGSSSNGVFRSTVGSATLSALAVQGQAAPGTGGGAFGFLGVPLINDAGQTAFSASITGGASNQALYRSSSGTALTPIAVVGQVAPGTGGATFRKLDLDLFLGSGGQVAFTAGLNGAAGANGVFIGDGRDLLAVQIDRAPLAGRTIDSVRLSTQPLNKHGQVAYTAVFTDGQTGVFVYTPDLRWRESFGAGWDNAGAWTLGIQPGAVHDVQIDPTTALTITGPAGAANVKSLLVGGGTGFATLRLNGGTLGAAETVQIGGRGILTGSGTIAAAVLNNGEVRADNVIITGGLFNQGSLRGANTGNQRIDAGLNNATTGIVRVDSGETLKLVGPKHGNAGSIQVQGSGDLQVTGALSNAPEGRISMSDGRISFTDGLLNQGQVQVSFGRSQLWGASTTYAGGKIILSGRSETTFHGAVEMLAGSELRVSAGATAVFFDKVSQRTGSLFTGTGTKFYEGGLSIGGSPGLGTDAGDVSFGAANVYLAEIGGVAAGSGFDKYIVVGHLALGGTLQLAWWNGFQGQAGQRFDLFDWGSSSGRFDSIEFGAAALGAGLQWDTSRLYTTGEVSITAVPEPGAGALLLAGLAVLGWRARRVTANEGERA